MRQLLKHFVKKLQICGVFFFNYISARETIKFTPALRSLLCPSLSLTLPLLLTKVASGLLDDPTLSRIHSAIWPFLPFVFADPAMSTHEYTTRLVRTHTHTCLHVHVYEKRFASPEESFPQFCVSTVGIIHRVP